MPSKEAIKVYLRTRPTADVTDDGGMALDVERGAVTLLGKRREDFGAVVHQREERTFKFSGGILHDATQERVYATLGAGMVSSVLQGVNATVMCYGQTGAGKTFTMTGGHGSYRHRGLVPRALADLFKRLSRETGVLSSCEVSYAEIYNELVVDLLRPQTPSADLVVMDDPERGVVVKNLTRHAVSSEEEAMRLLFEGEANRAVAEHKLNRASSRSHTVFTVSLELRRGPSREVDGSELDAPNGGVAARARMLRSKLNLVDLAGSERLDKTLSAGSVAREAQHINKSLSFLEQVIIALGDKQREHVPYRSSKLTHVLKDSLGGNCRTALVANVWGESAHVEETAGTCKFARRMMQVEMEPNVNVVEDPATKARRLEAQVAALTRQLKHARRDRVRAGDAAGPPGEDEEAEELARDFLRRASASPDSCDPLDAFLAYPDTARRALLAVRRVAKGMIDAYEREDKARAGANGAQSWVPTEELPEPEARAVGELEGRLRDDDATRVAGIAPADARPPADDPRADESFEPREPPGRDQARMIRENTADRVSIGGEPKTDDPPGTPPTPPAEDSASETAAARRSSSPAPASVSAPPDRNAAFEEYKNSEGATTSVALAENKAALRDRRARAKRLGLSINAVKKRLDAASARRESLARDRPPVPPPDVARASGREAIAEVLTEEEYACMLEVKALKREYRELFQEMKAAQSEAAYTERLIEQCKTTLVLEFESWYAREHGENGAPYGDEGRHASTTLRGVLASLESVPSSPAKTETLEASDETRERRDETAPVGSLSSRENAFVKPAAARTATNAPETSAPYDSEASSAAYYSAQSSSRARGARKGETPQARRIAAQSARPFAPRKS